MLIFLITDFTDLVINTDYNQRNHTIRYIGGANNLITDFTDLVINTDYNQRNHTIRYIGGANIFNHRFYGFWDLRKLQSVKSYNPLHRRCLFT